MTIGYKIFLIAIVEITLGIVFTAITPQDKKNGKIDAQSLVKGIIERCFLTYSLYNSFPHALTLFGALKLGTRLKSADNENTAEGRAKESKYNDYFLIGNLLSVGLSIFYYNLLTPPCG